MCFWFEIKMGKIKVKLWQHSTESRKCSPQNNTFTSIWHKRQNKDSWKYPGWEEHIKNIKIITIFPPLAETCKCSGWSDHLSWDKVEKSGSFHFEKLFHFRVKDKQNLSEISKRGQLGKPAKPMLKEKKSETWTANLPFRFNRTILN